MKRICLLPLFCVVLLVGCTSLQSPLQPGLSLEAEGEYAEAAEVYLGMLRAEPERNEVRRRLMEVGPRAVEVHLERAREAGDGGHYEAALEHVQALEQLRAEAKDAGVGLEPPGELERLRTEATTRITDSLRARARKAEEEGAWLRAEEAYFRALHYAPIEEHEGLHDAILTVQLRWAESHFEAERFREAFERARQLAELTEEDDPRWEEALRLARAAREAAAQHVALLPVGVADDLAGRVPQQLLGTLHEVLDEHFRRRAPTFVAPVSERAQQREFRRLRYDQHRISRDQALEIGRTLGADLVVLTEIVGYGRGVGSEQPVQRAAYPPEADSASVREVGVEVAYRLIDPFEEELLHEEVLHASFVPPAERPIAESSREREENGEAPQSRELSAAAAYGQLIRDERIVDFVDELSSRLYDHALTRVR